MVNRLSLSISSKALIVSALLFSGFHLPLHAQDASTGSEQVQQGQQQGQQDEEMENIRAVLTGTQPDMVIADIQPSPINGLYEVHVEDGSVIFASADAQYFIPGDLYTLGPQGLVNLGELKRSETRARRIAALDESGMIIFPAVGESQATLTVFTDVDCQYCRQLHTEVAQLNDRGITVRYLAFPRTGMDTETSRKMISVWCSDNPRVNLTSAKRGAQIPAADCDNPVAEHYQLGRDLGVTGTPALVFENGSLLPGYVPVDTLAAYLLGSPAP